MKRKAFTLLYPVFAQLLDQGADFAQAWKRAASGYRSRKAAILAGSGLPVAGSGREANSCAWNPAGVATAKNGKLFMAIRHSCPSSVRSDRARLRTRACASGPKGSPPPIDRRPCTGVRGCRNTRARDSVAALALGSK